MLSIRVGMFIDGYNRKVTNTEQFMRDLSCVDKLVSVIHENKNYYKIRIKYMDCIEIFNISVIDSYIREYFYELFTHDSVCTYDELINELYEIDGKRKRQ